MIHAYLSYHLSALRCEAVIAVIAQRQADKRQRRYIFIRNNCHGKLITNDFIIITVRGTHTVGSSAYKRSADVGQEVGRIDRKSEN